MGPKKSKRRQTNATNPQPPPKTVNCTKCNEPITIPLRCRHGKKPINCRGTDCTTAHITEHNAQCPARATKPSISQSIADEEELGVLSLLIKQEIENVEGMRGKKLRYLNGIPKAEFLGRIKAMGLEEARGLSTRLRDVAEGKLGLDVAMYDDEESDDEEDRCPTPPEED
ncbi:uncharacterized protein Z518_00792 [Rhinocladiella mackenziei CBS 650.93]|uniref:Uncharacterized protein n=1 Tax=Rhinocladiella mackenziei CBS 650.93 TaxID=1442369 RepID=A0A0D2J1Y4_9EURO|nr:uncharacterized protein Z518_00792 [Rhinocladiella mackenziei CBS 650.93]KIX09711.1 hypothetical protein Z518_00792 [Rhinocladiella mackenziei CBS 650.93]